MPLQTVSRTLPHQCPFCPVPLAGACPRPHGGVGLWVSAPPHCPCARGHIRSSAVTCVQHVRDRLLTRLEVGSDRDERPVLRHRCLRLWVFHTGRWPRGPIWCLTWFRGAADKLVIVPSGPREFLLMSCEIILFSSDSAFSTHYSVRESWG